MAVSSETPQPPHTLEHLGRLGSYDVEASDDAGAFYCDHVFYVASQTVGHERVGFLHVPRDAWTLAGTSEPPTDRLWSLASSLQPVLSHLVSLATARWQEMTAGLAPHEIPAKVDGLPPFVLLTGFAGWGEVQRNPSGDLILSPMLTAALRAAGHVVVEVGGDGFEVDGVIVWIHLLPVDDGAIDGGPRSIQAALTRFEPWCVLSMGVHRGAGLRVETVASDRGLATDPTYAHDVGDPGDGGDGGEAIPVHRLERPWLRAIFQTVLAPQR